MLFTLLKHYLELYITDTTLKVSRSLYCFITSLSHGIENYFPRLCGTGISDAIFLQRKFVFVFSLMSGLDRISNLYSRVYYCGCFLEKITIKIHSFTVL